MHARDGLAVAWTGVPNTHKSCGRAVGERRRDVTVGGQERSRAVLGDSSADAGRSMPMRDTDMHPDAASAVESVSAGRARSWAEPCYCAVIIQSLADVSLSRIRERQRFSSEGRRSHPESGSASAAPLPVTGVNRRGRKHLASLVPHARTTARSSNCASFLRHLVVRTRQASKPPGPVRACGIGSGCRRRGDDGERRVTRGPLDPGGCRSLR